MTIRILNRTVAALSAAVILSACGGGGDSAEGRASDPSAQSQGLVYAFPGDGQTEVSTASPVILRFTSSVNVGDAMNGITLYEGGADGRAMSPEFEPVQGQPNNLMLVPEENDPFKPNQQYTLVIEDLPLGGNGTAENRTLQFTTRALHEGPKELVVTDMDDFRITGAFPNFDNDNLGGEQRFQAMDFSSFRFQMSQPVDRATAVYGESVTLTYGPDDTEVPATLLVDGRYLTVDPEPEYLDPSQTYELTLTGDLASTYGANFAERSLRFKPQDTSPRGEPTRLVQRLTVNEPSKLTGRDVNTVPVNGTLLGEDENVTQARADSVIAELGDATVFSRTTPIRLPKGTILKGDAINPILIGGKVPAGFGSGEVTMTLLSDATGYLVQNRYMEDGENVSRMIQLMMDVGIATAEPRANGAFTQDLLHIELVGLADIDTSAGVLNVDAVSVVEPDILGQEYGYGLLSFQLQSYEDQTNAPQPMADTTAPTLQSWVPGDNADKLKPQDPIILNFDEPITVRNGEAISLYENGSKVDINVHVDGAALIIKPLSPLKNASENNNIEYSVRIDDPSAISDLSGNHLASNLSESFSLPKIVDMRERVTFGIPSGVMQPTVDRSPIVLSLYPGFPCALDDATRDLSALDAGRCAGAFPGNEQGVPEFDIKPEDDHIPVVTLGRNRAILVNFSKIIDENSIALGGSFKVERIDELENVLGDVAGQLKVEGTQLKFLPDEPWVVGQLYRYSLGSNGDLSGPAGTICDGTQAICDLSGLPLQTQPIGFAPEVIPTDEASPPYYRPPEREWQFVKEQVAANAGGPVLSQYFIGGNNDSNVIQTLSTQPSSDVNSNFIHEYNENVTDGTDLLALDVIVERYQYQEEEESAYGQPADPNADPSLDPNGVLPPPNSAKLFSRNTKGVPAEPAVTPDGQDVFIAPVLNGLVVGCGYGTAYLFDESVPEKGRYAEPLECPEQKFTYLKGALNAEVTDVYVEGKGLKVLIWPSQIMSTAINIRIKTTTGMSSLISQSGAQIMRMRYEANDEGERVNPITAWINFESGQPYLDANVDLYIDAPELKDATTVVDPTHSLISYPISMQLSGPVEFLSDGRMKVEQFNTNSVDIDLKIHTTTGLWAGPVGPLSIPAFGTRLQYVSDSIK